MNKYNEVEFDFEIWAWYGIDDDIRKVWDRRFGEVNVNISLNTLREWLKQKPEFQKTIDKGYGGNWTFFIWDYMERGEIWRKEKEAKSDGS